MSLNFSQTSSVSQVPQPNQSVCTARGQRVKLLGVSIHTLYDILVAHRTHEGLGKNPIEFRSIQCPYIFLLRLHRVKLRIVVSLYFVQVLRPVLGMILLVSIDSIYLHVKHASTQLLKILTDIRK